MITTCPRCEKAYDAGSEEQANEPDRLCWTCSAERARSVDVDVAEQRRRDRLELVDDGDGNLVPQSLL
jgi:hypothetical protein